MAKPFASFDVTEIASSLPETAETLLVDHRMTDEPEASARVFRVYRPTPRPFPNDKWARRPGADGCGIVKTIGIRAAADGTVWILDMGGNGEAPKLVGWDSVRDRLARVIVLPQTVLRPTSFCEDLAVDVARHKIYIADMTLNLAIGKSACPRQRRPTTSDGSRGPHAPSRDTVRWDSGFSEADPATPRMTRAR